MRNLLKIIGHKLFDAIIIVWKLSWMSHFAMIGKKATDINQVQYLSSYIFCNNNRGLAHNMIYEWTNKIFFSEEMQDIFLELENTSYEQWRYNSCTISCTKLYLFTEVDFQNEINFLNCFFSSWTVTTWLF